MLHSQVDCHLLIIPMLDYQRFCWIDIRRSSRISNFSMSALAEHSMTTGRNGWCC